MKASCADLLALACTALLVTACAEGGSQVRLDDEDVNAHPLAKDRTPPSGSNGIDGLLVDCFWAPGSQQALRTLGAGALDTGDDILPEIPTSQVPVECREVIDNAIRCALPEGQVVHDPVTGGDYEGWWGLAPSWLNGALDTAGQRYVTACMVQRLNATGTSVPILLEGPHPAIVENAELDPLYPVEESTAFGNLFSSTRLLPGLLPAFDVYVCTEGLDLSLLEERICDDLVVGLTCGLVTLGPCSLLGLGVPCAANGPYWKCKPPLGLLAPYWTETVRVQLESE